MSTAHDYWGKNELQDRYYDGDYDYIDEDYVSKDFRISQTSEYMEIIQQRFEDLEMYTKEKKWFNNQHYKMMRKITPVRRFNKMIIF